MTKASMHDETLGLLQWDDSLDRWSTDIDLGLDHSVELHIGGSKGGPAAAWLDYAKTIVERFRQREKQYRTAAAEQILECYNEAWTNGHALSLESFVERLELDSIVVIDGQTVEVAYLPIDEDMFGGHFIVCTIRDDDSVSDVHLVG